MNFYSAHSCELLKAHRRSSCSMKRMCLCWWSDHAIQPMPSPFPGEYYSVDNAAKIRNLHNHPTPITRTYPLMILRWYPNMILLAKLFQLNEFALVQGTSALGRRPRFIVTCKKTVRGEDVETSCGSGWVWTVLDPSHPKQTLYHWAVRSFCTLRWSFLPNILLLWRWNILWVRISQTNSSISVAGLFWQNAKYDYVHAMYLNVVNYFIYNIRAYSFISKLYKQNSCSNLKKPSVLTWKHFKAERIYHHQNQWKNNPLDFRCFSYLF